MATSRRGQPEPDQSESSNPRVRVRKPLRNAIAAGHPWVFDRALALPANLVAGQVVELVDERGPLALAFVEPGSPLAARVVAPPGTRLTASWVRDLLARAGRRRANDALLRDCTAVRLVHGEADGCPGLVVDRYANTIVVVYDGEAAAAFWEPALADVVAGLEAGTGLTFTNVWVRGQRAKRNPYAWRGTTPAPVEVSEGPAQFVVDVVNGQKTGFFLDQRENRRFIGRLASDKRVLNLYSYTGGFSIHAALGGARSVTSVDIAPHAVTAVATHMQRNNCAHSAHEHVCADVFDFIAAARASGRQWDLVICDPPSFAPSERARGAALRAYQRLLVECAALTAAAGSLAFASCSSHITEQDLLGLVAESLPQARIVALLGAGSDHPVLAGFPEGRYLKFMLLQL